MTGRIKVLLIESNALVMEAYEKALEHVALKNEQLSFEIIKVNTYDLAIEQIKKTEAIDVVFLDVRLPYSDNSSVLSGEFIGDELRNKREGTKIIVSTAYNNPSRILPFIKRLKPEGFLIKSDLTPEILINAVNRVLLAPPYYSKTVLKAIN